MDRLMHLRHLEEADSHIALGERLIAQQERRLADLAQHGHDTTIAKKLLWNFLNTQEEVRGHRERILKHLKEVPEA